MTEQSCLTYLIPHENVEPDNTKGFFPFVTFESYKSGETKRVI